MEKRLDLLNREEFIESTLNLISQLSEIQKGCCFAIEGRWGIGKTFVINEVEHRLEEIKIEDTNENKYFVFNYNCWKYDYYTEPTVAIISTMISAIQKNEAAVNVDWENGIKAGYEFVAEKIKEIVGMYCENVLGVNLVEWGERINEIKDENEKKLKEFDKMFNFTQIIEKVRTKLKEISEKGTIVFIVDELDRCIPSYAIKVLERLHHVFYDLENIVVVISIDRRQLENSVEKMFGIKDASISIDTDKYLKKFIDFSLVLDDGMINETFKEKYKFYFDKFNIEQEDMECINDVLPILLKGIDIRTQEKIVEKANVIHSLISKEMQDVSILIFEIMYEVLREVRISDFSKVALVNDIGISELENKLDKEKICLLKVIGGEAWREEGGADAYGNIVYKKCINDNIYGKVVWYFLNIFNVRVENYGEESIMKNYEKLLDVAKKYCEFSRVIR